jgi:hypothetical protein
MRRQQRQGRVYAEAATQEPSHGVVLRARGIGPTACHGSASTATWFCMHMQVQQRPGIHGHLHANRQPDVLTSLWPRCHQYMCGADSERRLPILRL